MAERWLSTTEAARRMGLTQREVLELALADKLDHRVDLDHHVVSAESVGAYLKAQEVELTRGEEREYRLSQCDDDVNENQGEDEQ